MGKERTVIRDPVIMQRFRVAVDLFETSQKIMRQNLRRRNPNLDDREIDVLMEKWRRHRPDAPLGDAEGRPVPEEKVAEWLASKES